MRTILLARPPRSGLGSPIEVLIRAFLFQAVECRIQRTEGALSTRDGFQVLLYCRTVENVKRDLWEIRVRLFPVRSPKDLQSSRVGTPNEPSEGGSGEGVSGSPIG